MNIYGTGIYAQTAVGQDDFTEQREIAETIKRIEGQSAIIMSCLGQWLRCHKYVPLNTKEAKAVKQSMQQAMTGLMTARNEQNALFRELFGIQDDRLAIGKD